MERKIFVYIDINDQAILVGQLWTRILRGKESASFEYNTEWLARPDSFSLEPALMLSSGIFHTGGDKPMFGSIGDSAPDRWGRALMRRAERRRAKDSSETPRTLFEADYLLMVNDFSRQGALRFSLLEGGPFLNNDSSKKIPPLLALPKLLSAANNITSENETLEDLRLLLAPGSSLGGARPKASVLDNDGTLLIAKFPSKDDEINTVCWESVALKLAGLCGITTTVWRINQIAKKQILLLKRFDRVGTGLQKRIPFVSAMSMLGAKDNEVYSYLDIANVLKMYGAKPKEDLSELFSRMIFNILISNTDDHLRNHGFLYQDIDGWRLSPAYDLNPVPVDLKPRILSTNITQDDGTATIELALSVVAQFGLEIKSAKKIINKQASVIANWRKIAEVSGLTTRELDRMESAFEHTDLSLGVKL